VATLNHDASRLLGRLPATLEVEDRGDGLHWSCELPSGPTGEDVRVAVERGDLRSTSWRMVVARDRCEGDVRHVEEVRELRARSYSRFEQADALADACAVQAVFRLSQGPDLMLGADDGLASVGGVTFSLRDARRLSPEIDWPAAKIEREGWREALTRTRKAWQAAYDGAPMPPIARLARQLADSNVVERQQVRSGASLVA
jgi:hypothetical protein